jgi:hypothetical protein
MVTAISCSYHQRETTLGNHIYTEFEQYKWGLITYPQPTRWYINKCNYLASTIKMNAGKCI